MILYLTLSLYHLDNIYMKHNTCALTKGLNYEKFVDSFRVQMVHDLCTEKLWGSKWWWSCDQTNEYN